MHYLFENKKLIVYGALMSILAVGISFLSLGISIWVNAPRFPYYIFLFIFDFLFGLFAYVFGDIIIVKYKKQVGEMNPVIPEEVNNRIWNARWPFIVALIITSVVILVFLIITLFIGGWPFLV